MGGVIPVLVVLGSKRKQFEQAIMSKPVSSTPQWSLPQVPVLISFDKYTVSSQQS